MDTGNESDTDFSTVRPSGARRGRGRPSKAPSRPLEALRKDLVDLYAGMGLLAKPFLPLPALVLVKQAEDCADAWVRAAEVNPVIRRVLEGFSTASVYGALIMAHAPIAVAFQVQLGRLPVEHPLATGIRPEIQIVVDENARAAAAAERAAQEAAAAAPQ